MSKHLSPFYKYVLVSLFVLFLFQQVFSAYVAKTYAKCRFIDRSIPQSECPVGPAPTFFPANSTSWHAWDIWATFDIDYAFQNPDSVSEGATFYSCAYTPMNSYAQVTCPAGAMESYCCQTDSCGNCTETCTRPKTVCIIPTIFPSPSYYPPECRCWECKVCTLCLTQAAQPTNATQREATVGESCECLELNPVEDKKNHKLSFECLVAGGKDTQIKDYTVTFEKPGGDLITRNKDTVNPVSCPSSVAPDSTCYQVKTTSVDTTVKGTYKMIVPPQITCQ